MKQDDRIKDDIAIYCPGCEKVTDRISFNLLREAKNVEVTCPFCGCVTCLEYDEKKVTLWHHIT